MQGARQRRRRKARRRGWAAEPRPSGRRLSQKRKNRKAPGAAAGGFLLSGGTPGSPGPPPCETSAELSALTMPAKGTSGERFSSLVEPHGRQSRPPAAARRRPRAVSSRSSRRGVMATMPSNSSPTRPPRRRSIVDEQAARDEDPRLRVGVAVGHDAASGLAAADHVGDEVVHLAQLRAERAADLGVVGRLVQRLDPEVDHHDPGRAALFEVGLADRPQPVRRLLLASSASSQARARAPRPRRGRRGRGRASTAKWR